MPGFMAPKFCFPLKYIGVFNHKIATTSISLDDSLILCIYSYHNIPNYKFQHGILKFLIVPTKIHMNIQKTHPNP